MQRSRIDEQEKFSYIFLVSECLATFRSRTLMIAPRDHGMNTETPVTILRRNREIMRRSPKACNAKDAHQSILFIVAGRDWKRLNSSDLRKRNAAEKTAEWARRMLQYEEAISPRNCHRRNDCHGVARASGHLVWHPDWPGFQSAAPGIRRASRVCATGGHRASAGLSACRLLRAAAASDLLRLPGPWLEAPACLLSRPLSPL